MKPDFKKLLAVLLLLGAERYNFCCGQNENTVIECSTKDFNSLELKESETGYIESQNYPDTVSKTNTRDCSVIVTACPYCKIQLTIDDLVLEGGNCDSNGEIGSCIVGCNHVFMYEPDAAMETSKKAFQLKELVETTSRRLIVKLCRATKEHNIKFRFKVIALEKSIKKVVVHEGSEPAVITSPYYPKEYSIFYGNEIYRYKFESIDTEGIKLIFTDWNLHLESSVKIYYESGWQAPNVVRKGTDKRPFICFTLENPIYMEFLTGRNDAILSTLPFEPFMGFRAEVTATTSINNRCYTDCGKYYKDIKSGTFSVNDATFCQHRSDFDCIFVIAKYPRACFTNVMLRFNSIHMELDQTLTVREGSTSQDRIIGKFSTSYHNRTGITYSSGGSYYVHYKGKCRNQGPRLEAVFASYSPYTENVLNSCIPTEIFICQDKSRVLPIEVKCDGIIHCEDASDEKMCQTEADTTVGASCPAVEHTACIYENIYFCPSQKCDGIRNCRYGTDEKDCPFLGSRTDLPPTSKTFPFTYSWSTVIPVALVCVVVAFVTCLLVNMWTNRKKARQTRLANSRGGITGMPMSNLSDVPPSYDDAVFHPTPPPFVTYTNLSYTGTDSPQYILQPPPYSPPLTGLDAARLNQNPRIHGDPTLNNTDMSDRSAQNEIIPATTTSNNLQGNVSSHQDRRQQSNTEPQEVDEVNLSREATRKVNNSDAFMSGDNKNKYLKEVNTDENSVLNAGFKLEDDQLSDNQNKSYTGARETVV